VEKGKEENKQTAERVIRKKGKTRMKEEREKRVKNDEEENENTWEGVTGKQLKKER
jgi:hypothetical protein